MRSDNFASQTSETRAVAGFLPTSRRHQCRSDRFGLTTVTNLLRSTAGKGIGAGFPLGVVLAVAKVSNTIKPGSHGSTLGGAPLAMAVGNAVLDVMLADGFLSNDRNAGHVSRMGDLLRSELERIVSDHPDIFEEVRGVGLLLGLKCKVDNRQLMAALQARGMLTGPAGNNVIRVLPPLIVEPMHIAEAVAIIRQTCSEFAGH